MSTEKEHGPFLSLEWNSLFLTLKSKGKPTKNILNGCTGFMPAGHLLAVMGPSGSGKTSFINALADRTPTAKGLRLSGELMVGGVPRHKVGAFSRISSYVLQDDNLYPMLTVYETLLLAARFRLPSSVTLMEKRAAVEALINDLGIRSARDVQIGDEKSKGVSGGERKRTAVGVEIIGKPRIIFLDEPTSGLDAFQALKVIQMVNSLCAVRGCTIVISIHQPRSSIYSLFDQLLLLAKGMTIFHGDATAAVARFGTLGFECPKHFNPADFFIDLVSVDTQAGKSGDADVARIEELASAAESAQLGDKHGHHAALASSAAKPESDPEAASLLGGMDQKALCCGATNSTLAEQFALLYGRALRSRIRDKIALIAPIFVSIFFALVAGWLYSGLTLYQKSIQDRTGILFFVCINQAFGGIFSVINTFPLEKKIVDRERTAGAYAVFPYYIAKWSAELPFAALGPFIFGCIIYWMVGFQARADKFFIFCGIIVMINATAVAWGMFISSTADSVQQATGLAPLILIIFLLFGGFYINTENIPVELAWISEISFFKWGFKALCMNEYSGLVFLDSRGRPCPESMAMRASDLLAVNATILGPPPCAYVNGEQVLELLTFSEGSIGLCILWLAIILLVAHTMAYFCLMTKRVKFTTLEPPDAEHMVRVPITQVHVAVDSLASGTRTATNTTTD